MISIHKDKNNQWDFGVSAAIAYLTVEEMNELRVMAMCAIGAAEEMFQMGARDRQDCKEEA